MVRPLVRALGHTNPDLTQAQLAILSVELDVLLSTHQQLKSLLQYTHRMPDKSPTNPARLLHKKLMEERGPHHQRIQTALLDLSLTETHMKSPLWPDLLRQQLRRHTQTNMITFVHSTNVSTYTSLFFKDLSSTHSLFHKQYPKATHVLLLRLHLAPLATMQQDDSLATCRRCQLNIPDTISHWLLHCPALTPIRQQFLSSLKIWSESLDTTLNTRHSVSISERWSTLSLTHQLQALTGTIPTPLQSMLTHSPAPQNQTHLPQPPHGTPPPYQPYGSCAPPATEVTSRTDASLLGNLVYIMNKYCKRSFAVPNHNQTRAGRHGHF